MKQRYPHIPRCPLSPSYSLFYLFLLILEMTLAIIIFNYLILQIMTLSLRKPSKWQKRARIGNQDLKKESFDPQISKEGQSKFSLGSVRTNNILMKNSFSLSYNRCYRNIEGHPVKEKGHPHRYLERRIFL